MIDNEKNYSIEEAICIGEKAFSIYRKFTGAKKALFLRAIANEIEALGNDLIYCTMKETNLPEARLMGERGRTCMQLRMFADLVEEGSWVDARVDFAITDRLPIPKVDIRKLLQAIGPVGIFAASNFPFAFSTAGGDTAAALAAGCSVIMKAHSGHLETSIMVAKAINKAAKETGMPEGVFNLIIGKGETVGKYLVEHRAVKAIGFTGSYNGGMALYEMANARKEPIPVFAEMSSINPVILMPEKLKEDFNNIAKLYAGSITQGVGQFCTNPGLILGIESVELDEFIKVLGLEIGKIAPAPMLNTRVYESYLHAREDALSQEKLKLDGKSEILINGKNLGIPMITSTNGVDFLSNKKLHEEVFGPYSLIVKCKNIDELYKIINELEGQLTATLIATEAEMEANIGLIDELKNKCGRILFNGVPTGVEVCASMHHGGAFPSTTDSRFTSVGTDAIKRFVKPVCYQGFPNSLLPDELKDNNPLNIWRMVDGKFSK